MLITFAFLTDATLKTFGWVLFLDKNGAANYLLAQIGCRRRWSRSSSPTGRRCSAWSTTCSAFAIFTIYLSIEQYRPLADPRRL